MIKVTLDDEYFGTVARPADLAAMIALGDAEPQRYALDTEDFLAWQERAARDEIRARVADRVGDTESLLSATADGTQVLLYGVSSLMAGLSQAQSLEDVRAAAAPFAAMSADFLQNIDSGEVVLPFLIKGVENVIRDIETLSTSVSEVIVEVTYGGV